MVHRRVYIETSVWGMVSPDQSRVLREPTLQFLDQCQRRIYLPHISEIVATEISQAPPATQEQVLHRISEVNPILLSVPAEAEILAERFVEQGILGRRRLDDGRHVACALVSEMDLLVSWNYRHIANVRKAERFNAIAILAGLRGGLAIHTPLEVLEWI